MKELFQHAAITDGITVRVAVSFLPDQSQIEAGKWFWVYHIRIENGSDEAVQLLTRHWKITQAHPPNVSRWSAIPPESRTPVGGQGQIGPEVGRSGLRPSS